MPALERRTCKAFHGLATGQCLCLENSAVLRFGRCTLRGQARQKAVAAKCTKASEAAVDVRAVTHRDRTWGIKLGGCHRARAELEQPTALTAAGRSLVLNATESPFLHHGAASELARESTRYSSSSNSSSIYTLKYVCCRIILLSSIIQLQSSHLLAANLYTSLANCQVFDTLVRLHAFTQTPTFPRI
jgi:hypothetical protein